MPFLLPTKRLTDLNHSKSVAAWPLQVVSTSIAQKHTHSTNGWWWWWQSEPSKLDPSSTSKHVVCFLSIFRSTLPIRGPIPDLSRKRWMEKELLSGLSHFPPNGQIDYGNTNYGKRRDTIFNKMSTPTLFWMFGSLKWISQWNSQCQGPHNAINPSHWNVCG